MSSKKINDLDPEETLEWIENFEKGSKFIILGRNITNIPIKPKVMADHLLQPTFSLSIKTDNTVTINGPTANIADACIKPIL